MDVDIFSDPAGAARIYQPLTNRLGDEFQLNRLYLLFNKENIAHPHLTIRALREAGYLVRVSEDRFSWNLKKI